MNTDHEICERCGKKPADEPHLCPLSFTLFDDEEECNCCADCCAGCAEEV